MAASNHTPGPWQWMGNVDNKSIYLAAPANGIDKVMDFVRFGMQGAQPRFSDAGLMWPSSNAVRFAVCPEAMSRDDERVYRGDVSGIDHPDARLIAAAPELLQVCEDVAQGDFRKDPELSSAIWEAAIAAVAKARGRQ